MDQRELCPGGHVRITDAPQSPRMRDLPLPRGTGEWSIRDAAGTVVASGLESRADALRAVGLAALRGADLPLLVYGPDGLATGDRLAG